MSYTGADFIAEALADLGVRYCFAIVSIHNMPMLDAVNRLGKTRIIDARHEQAGTHAADGYARATGEMGVMIASTGPGTTNTVTGLYEAQYASSRVLVITGQAETNYYGKGLSYVHEAENQLPMLRAVTRRAESPRRPEQLADAFHAVVQDMHTGRPSSGALEIPIDIQYAEVASKPRAVQIEPATPPPDAITAAVDAIAGGRSRVIIAGGGVIAAGASAELTALAEQLDAPVITTVDGRGSIPEDHRLCIGNFYQNGGLYQAIAKADVTIAIGTKFAVGVEGNGAKLVPPGNLVHVDVDPNMISRVHPADVGVVADARLAIQSISAALMSNDAVAPNDAQFNEGVLEAGEAVKHGMRDNLGADYPQVMDLMREHLPRDGLWLRDSTVPAYFFGNQLFPVYEPRSSINPSSGAIGPGLPLAIGAAVGTGQKTLLINGDGGFMFHATELATAAQYQLPLVVVVFNDGGYGILRWLQGSRFKRINETELGKVDFVGMAQSMGVPGERVASVEEFDVALKNGMASDGPYLIDLDMDQFEGIKSLAIPDDAVRVNAK